MEGAHMKIKDITKIAIMSALVSVATYFFKIPTVAGYTHLGDCMIFISVLILGWKKGALAGGIGAALADFIGGYMHWVVPTFFIKLVMGIIVGLMAERVFSERKYGWIVGAIIGGTFQIAAYTLVKIPLYGWQYALATIPTLTGQTVSGIVIAVVLISVLFSYSAIRKLREL